MSSVQRCDILLKPSECAERLCVSDAKVFGWLHSGKLPSVKIGCEGAEVSRVKLTDLRQFMIDYNFVIQSEPVFKNKRKGKQ